jgi:glycogen debranching enzyme
MSLKLPIAAKWISLLAFLLAPVIQADELSVDAVESLPAPPKFESSPVGNSTWIRGFEAVYKELRNNLRKPDKKVHFIHAHPAPKFTGIYLWDSAFIALIWNKWDPSIAKQIIQSVLQFQRHDGRIPHVVSIQGISEWSQPAVLAWAAERIARSTNDVDFARKVYPALRLSNEWMFRERRLKNGLFFWEHPYESGIDNSPRFGTRDESKFLDTREFASIDASSYAAMDLEALKSIAQLILTNPLTAAEAKSLREDIERYTKQHSDLATQIRDLLWDEKSSYFYDLNIKTGELFKIPTIASFFPLTAGVATEAQAAKLIAHLANPAEFNTKIPFPTVARNHPTFEKDCWRGPVWVNTAYLTIQGMKRYGATALAKDMAWRLVDGVYTTWENTGDFVEFYDTDRFDFKELTRKRGIGPLNWFSGSKKFDEFLVHLFAKQIYLGQKPVNHFVGWTGLVNNIYLEDLSNP